MAASHRLRGDDALGREATLAADNPAMSVPASQSLSTNGGNVRNRLGQGLGVGGSPKRCSKGGNEDHSETNDNDAISSSNEDTQVATPRRNSAIRSASQVPIATKDAPPPLQRLPTKHDRGWRRITRNFSPSWFSVTMGTGVVSLLLINISLVFPTHPVRTQTWLYWLSIVFLVLNGVVFSLAFLISVLRYTLYPAIWSVMIRDPNNSLFLATIPMGFATIVDVWVLACCPFWGRWSVLVAWGAWMLDSVVAVAVTTALPFLLMSGGHQPQSPQNPNGVSVAGLERITAAQLLPIAATIVASGTGTGVAAELAASTHADDQGKALATLIACYVLWAMAMPMALTVLVIYYQRLALHKLPSREVIVSCFLPLGPLGMGGYTIMQCGVVAREVFPVVDFLGKRAGGEVAGEVAYVLGVFVALLFWGWGLVWLVFAMSSILSVGSFPFNMGWWGFTFPLGVYALSTMHLGLEMPSLFFRVLGTIFAVAVICLWVVVAAGTARGAWRGHLFYAPCLRNLRPEDQVKDGSRDAEKEAVVGVTTGGGSGAGSEKT